MWMGGDDLFGVLEDDQPFRMSNRIGDGRDESGLSGARGARDKDVGAARHEIGDFLLDAGIVDEVGDAATTMAQHA